MIIYKFKKLTKKHILKMPDVSNLPAILPLPALIPGLDPEPDAEPGRDPTILIA